MRIFLTGAPPWIDVNNTSSKGERFDLTGRNTGNQVISYGLLNRLSYDEVVFDPHLSPSEVNARFDHILIGAANFNHSGFDFGYLADFLEGTSLPVTIVGLGAQSNDLSKDIDLLPGTERFLKIVSDPCRLMGVRGAYTAEILNRRGITNLQITGCPSYYADFGNVVPNEAPRLRPDSRIGVNASRDVIGHGFNPEAMAGAIKRLMQVAVERDADFIAQTEHEEIVIAESYVPDLSPYLTSLYNQLGLGVSRESFDNWAMRRCKVYWDVADWIGAMEGLDFVLGTRFHGAMAALLAGTPALVLCHDSRTLEMCDFLQIPHLPVDTMNRMRLEEIHAAMDLAAFNTRRAQLGLAYSAFLFANGLEMDEQPSVKRPGKIAASAA